jgi:hypothetical protein
LAARSTSQDRERAFLRATLRGRPSHRAVAGRRHAPSFFKRDPPVDALEQIFDDRARLVQEGTLFEQSRDDALDERDLRVLEPLKAPAIELQAEDIVDARKPGVDHLGDAGLAGTPVAVHADRHQR